MMPDPTDRQFEDSVIAKVEPGDDDYSLTFESGWSFWCPKKGIEPHIGDIARLYGKGIGFTVRGLAINGQVVFYRTEDEDRQRAVDDQASREAEQRTDYAEKAEGYERVIRDLPPVFQRRIERFRRTNPDFNWKYLPYELSCCVDGAKIALHCKTPDAVPAFRALNWSEQQQRIPDLFDGHSGNSFGMAIRLAMYFVTEPRYVVLEHGAISALIGCEDFGCLPGQGLEGEDFALYESLKAVSS